MMILLPQRKCHCVYVYVGVVYETEIFRQRENAVYT